MAAILGEICSFALVFFTFPPIQTLYPSPSVAGHKLFKNIKTLMFKCFRVLSDNIPDSVHKLYYAEGNDTILMGDSEAR